MVEFRERTSAPESHSLVEDGHRPCRITLGCVAGDLDLALELGRVGRRLEPVAVSGGADGQPSGAKPQHVRGDGVSRRERRFLTPCRGLECEERYGASAAKGESGENAPLLAATSSDLLLAVADLERSEHANLHGVSLAVCCA